MILILTFAVSALHGTVPQPAHPSATSSLGRVAITQRATTTAPPPPELPAADAAPDDDLEFAPADDEAVTDEHSTPDQSPPPLASTSDPADADAACAEAATVAPPHDAVRGPSVFGWTALELLLTSLTATSVVLAGLGAAVACPPSLVLLPLVHGVATEWAAQGVRGDVRAVEWPVVGAYAGLVTAGAILVGGALATGSAMGGYRHFARRPTDPSSAPQEWFLVGAVLSSLLTLPVAVFVVIIAPLVGVLLAPKASRGEQGPLGRSLVHLPPVEQHLAMRF